MRICQGFFCSVKPNYRVLRNEVILFHLDALDSSLFDAFVNCSLIFDLFALFSVCKGRSLSSGPCFFIRCFLDYISSTLMKLLMKFSFHTLCYIQSITTIIAVEGK